LSLRCETFENKEVSVFIGSGKYQISCMWVTTLRCCLLCHGVLIKESRLFYGVAASCHLFFGSSALPYVGSLSYIPYFPLSLVTFVDE